LKNNMAFLKIPRHRLYLNRRIFLKIAESFLRGKVIFGKEIEEFERKFAEYMGVKYAIAVPSGRMALYLSLKAMNFNKGDEIILPSFTVPEVVTVIRCAGMIPNFVDVNPSTCNMEEKTIQGNLTSKTKAILLTHIFGQPCSIEPILRISQKYELKIIEDAAQACGAEYKGKKTGTFGDIGYFSFGIVKNFNCLGGGMIITDDSGLCSKIREELELYSPPSKISLFKNALSAFFVWLFTNPLIFTFTVYPFFLLISALKIDLIDIMFNEDPDEILATEIPEYYKINFSNMQAIIGLEQLKILDYNNNKRMGNAVYLYDLLKNTRGIKLTETIEGVKNIYLNFFVQVEKREELLMKLLKRGIDSTKGFLLACSHEKWFSEYFKECPESLNLSRSGIYLPIYPSLSQKDIKYIAEALKDCLEKIQ